jgi:hypothetical protein
MVTKNKKTGKSDFTPAEASDAKRKRRRIYRELDESMAKGRKFLDKETDEEGNLSQRAKNLQQAIIAARKTGEISDLGVKDIADELKNLAKGGMVKKYKKGGSVHKKKNKMATTKGWGASRKT